jgi:hypothetical protein
MYCLVNKGQTSVKSNNIKNGWLLVVRQRKEPWSLLLEISHMRRSKTHVSILSKVNDLPATLLENDEK